MRTARADPGSAAAGSAGPAPGRAASIRSAPAGDADRAGTGGHGEYPSPALLNAPPAVRQGRPSPDQPRDIAAELAGWNQGELPSQRPEQFASWPPGMPTGAD